MTSVDATGAPGRTCLIKMDDGSLCGRPLHRSRICNTHVSRQRRGNPMGSPIKEGNFAGPKKPETPRVCAVDGCQAPHYGHGFCINHRNRWIAYGDPTAGMRSRKVDISTRFREPRYERERDAFGRLLCTKCEEWLAEEWFGMRESKMTGRYRSYCKRCDTDTRHGVSIDKLRVLWDHQNGRCPCGTALIRHGERHLAYHIDHDHTCCSGTSRSCGKCVRGLLCPSCNIAIGMAEEDPLRLLALADYLIGLKEKDDMDV